MVGGCYIFMCFVCSVCVLDCRLWQECGEMVSETKYIRLLTTVSRNLCRDEANIYFHGMIFLMNIWDVFRNSWSRKNQDFKLLEVV